MKVLILRTLTAKWSKKKCTKAELLSFLGRLFTSCRHKLLLKTSAKFYFFARLETEKKQTTGYSSVVATVAPESSSSVSGRSNMTHALKELRCGGAMSLREMSRSKVGGGGVGKKKICK